MARLGLISAGDIERKPRYGYGVVTEFVDEIQIHDVRHSDFLPCFLPWGPRIARDLCT